MGFNRGEIRVNHQVAGVYFTHLPVGRVFSAIP